jgi:hypothetical protein
MDDLQRETLRSLLKTTERTPPQHQQEQIEMAVKANIGLYRQENDPEGARVYEQLLPLVLKASRQELDALVR